MTSLVRKLSIVALLILAGLACACSDDDSPSKRPLLVDKTWIVVRYELNGEDVTDEREECDVDDTTTFFEDGTFTDDVGIPCDEFDTDVQGTWAFKANETILSMRPANETASDWTILELTETTLKMSQSPQGLELEIIVVMAPR